MACGNIGLLKSEPDTVSDKARGFALLSAPYSVVGHAGAKAFRPLHRLHLWGYPRGRSRARSIEYANLSCQEPACKFPTATHYI